MGVCRYRMVPDISLFHPLTYDCGDITGVSSSFVLNCTIHERKVQAVSIVALNIVWELLDTCMNTKVYLLQI